MNSCERKIRSYLIDVIIEDEEGLYGLSEIESIKAVNFSEDYWLRIYKEDKTFFGHYNLEDWVFSIVKYYLNRKMVFNPQNEVV